LIHFYKRINAIMAGNSKILTTILLLVGYTNAEGSGNWTTDCIKISMDAKLQLNTDAADTNKTVTVDIPATAVVSKDESSCNYKNISQRLTLTWEDADPDRQGETLNRNFTIEFSQNTTTNFYGVSRINGVYELRTVNETDPKTNSSALVKYYVSFTTFTLDVWQFGVSLNRSYTCGDVGLMTLEAELHKSNENAGDPGERLANGNFTATNVHFDAFRPSDVTEDKFQTASDCSYRPSDVVPIIVGCALAGMVVMVLVAYMVGRSRSRARGYQSV